MEQWLFLTNGIEDTWREASLSIHLVWIVWIFVVVCCCCYCKTSKESVQEEENLEASPQDVHRNRSPEGPVGGRHRARPVQAARAGENHGIPRTVLQHTKGELDAT